MSQPIIRRTLLKGAAAGIGVAASGTVLAACGGGSPKAAPSASTASTLPFLPGTKLAAGDRPFPNRAIGVDMLPQIKHVVVVMMENHSFDNYLGMLGRGEGFKLGSDGQPTNSNPGPDGTPVKVFHAGSVCQSTSKVSQAWDVSHQSWNQGAVDGFVKAKGTTPMGYFTGEDLPFYWSLARTFPLCDRYFSPTLAQTYPNRRFAMAASAFGLVDDTLPTSTTDSPRPGGFGTIFDLLDKYGVSWKNYYTDLPTTLLFPYVYVRDKQNVVKLPQFFADAAAGNLPGYSVVEPNFSHQSEENPQNVQNGQYFAFQVIDAVMKSPNWPETLLIWTYDEHGGYYDHVPPPRAIRPDDIAPNVAATDTYGDLYSWYGFRVPAVVVSPWAKKSYVSHVQHSHTSILRLLETKWNLPALSNRDANSSNLLDTLDLGAKVPPFLTPPTLTPAQPVSDATVAACSALSKGSG
jgi:phospholipase C